METQVETDQAGETQWVRYKTPELNRLWKRQIAAVVKRFND